jgi:hypothetical protein
LASIVFLLTRMLHASRIVSFTPKRNYYLADTYICYITTDTKKNAGSGIIISYSVYFSDQNEFFLFLNPGIIFHSFDFIEWMAS